MKIPCKECISFAICKQRIKEWTDPPDITTFSRMIDCPPIRHYTDNAWNKLYSYDINHLREFFGLPMIKCPPEKYQDHVVVFKIGDSEASMSFGNCDCTLVNTYRKDCKHEIITEGKAT